MYIIVWIEVVQSQLIWDQSNDMDNVGYESGYYPSENTIIRMADDFYSFNMNIQSIRFFGKYFPTEAAQKTTNWTLLIYDSAFSLIALEDVPNSVVYQSNIIPLEGLQNTASNNYTFVLPTPLNLPQGHYFVSVVPEISGKTSNQWIVFFRNSIYGIASECTIEQHSPGYEFNNIWYPSNEFPFAANELDLSFQIYGTINQVAPPTLVQIFLSEREVTISDILNFSIQILDNVAFDKGILFIQDPLNITYQFHFNSSNFFTGIPTYSTYQIPISFVQGISPYGRWTVKGVFMQNVANINASATENQIQKSGNSYFMLREEPSLLLYSQFNPSSEHGYSSSNYPSGIQGECESYYLIQASDDFIVPNASSFLINTLYSPGFYSEGGEAGSNTISWNVYFYNSSLSPKFGIEVPGNLILNQSLVPFEGIQTSEGKTFDLDVPLVLDAGRYFFSVMANIGGPSLNSSWNLYVLNVSTKHTPFSFLQNEDCFCSFQLVNEWIPSTSECGPNEPLFQLSFEIFGYNLSLVSTTTSTVSSGTTSGIALTVGSASSGEATTGTNFSSNNQIVQTQKNSSNLPIIISVSIIFVVIVISILIISLFYVYKKQELKRKQIKEIPEKPGNRSSINFISDRNSINLSLNDLEESLLIDYNSIKILKKIGEGSQGEVFLGLLNGTEVAVKKIRSNNITDSELKNFENELFLLKQVSRHPNVVLFRGTCLEPLCLVTDYCEGGSLVRLLRSNKEITDDEKIMFMRDIARGMLHLHSQKKMEIIHRDLAARNILLKRGVALISDLGMARMKTDENEFEKTYENIGPIKWMSPESFLKKEYSKKSDVFSFGVLMWEIITRQEPWAGLSAVQASHEVAKGNRMEIPKTCNPILKNLIQMCWRENPGERPDFYQILEALLSIKIKCEEDTIDETNNNQGKLPNDYAITEWN